MASPGGAAAARSSGNDNDSNATRATRAATRAAATKLHFEVILERRWLATQCPEAARRALLGAFACVVAYNAGDRDAEWGLQFLRVLAKEHLALAPEAVEDVELLATGGWPEAGLYTS